MHEHQGADASQDIYSLVQLCLKTEQDSGLAENSLKEIKRYLNEFTYHCKSRNVHSVKELTPEFLRRYADQRCDGAGPNLKKAVVWSLRKFGRHLAMRQVLKEDPAKHLRHPRFHPRSELPDYLSEAQLRRVKGSPITFTMSTYLFSYDRPPFSPLSVSSRHLLVTHFNWTDYVLQLRTVYLFLTNQRLGLTNPNKAIKLMSIHNSGGGWFNAIGAERPFFYAYRNFLPNIFP